MVLHGTINLYVLGYGSQDAMNSNFLSSVLMNFLNTQSLMHGSFKSYLSDAGFFPW